MELLLLNNSIIASQDERGIWIYKSNPNSQFKAILNKDHVLKQKYHDLPRYGVIVESENRTVEDYESGLVESIKEIAQVLNSFGN